MVIRLEANLVGPLDKEILGLSHRGNAGKVALDVSGEHRDTGVGKGLGQYLKRHGLAGAGRASDETVAVGIFQREIFALLNGIIRLAAGADENLTVLKHEDVPIREQMTVFAAGWQALLI